MTYLANRPGEVIAKQESMDHVWSDVTVEEGSLRVHVAALRKELGDGQCQSACKFDPSSASNFDPLARRGLAVALVSSELAGIAEARRARVA